MFGKVKDERALVVVAALITAASFISTVVLARCLISGCVGLETVSKGFRGVYGTHSPR
jgi:hypothetical protein